MNIFEEAAAFMKNHPTHEEANHFLQTPESREQFIRELKMIYDNATNREIEKAVDWVLENNQPPYQKEIILKLIRPKLED